MQLDLFGKLDRGSLTVQQAAQGACVSTATIRNWIKTGYLAQAEKGLVTQISHEYFMSHVAGKKKLNARANKSQKDGHDHREVSGKIAPLCRNFSGEAIGTEYEKLLSDTYRNKKGIYYTPSTIIQDMFQGVEFNPAHTFLDPCCGSGNFLVEAVKAGIAPENIYGFDTDQNAVFMARERIKKEFGIDPPHVRVGDFLQEVSALEKEGRVFDLIFTNPPWGQKNENPRKKKKDSSSLFFHASMPLLKAGGTLGFLMQDAFFNIAAFEETRKELLQNKIVRLIDYGRAFKGLLAKAQAVVLENSRPNPDAQTACTCDNKTHYRSLNSFNDNPKHIINFRTDESESRVIDRLYAVEHTTLRGKARWALGIVTGNNQEYCRHTPFEGCIPVYRGADITKHRLKEATLFIPGDVTLFQQVAPIEMYRAEEKLIYRFISSDLCFYLDDRQRFILNSANLLIPSGIGITTRQLTALLNSEIMNWLFKKLFSTHKVLRGDLESLPLHTGYFSDFSGFSEETYLQYLRITKTEDGTYRTENEHN